MADGQMWTDLAKLKSSVFIEAYQNEIGFHKAEFLTKARMNVDEVQSCTGASDKIKTRCVPTPVYLPAVQMTEACGVPVAMEIPLMKPESFGVTFENTHTDAILCDLHHNVFAQIQLFSPDIVLSTVPKEPWGLVRILCKLQHVNRISANVKPVGYYLINLLHLLPKAFQKRMNQIFKRTNPGMLL